jgi:predicted transport protein
MNKARVHFSPIIEEIKNRISPAQRELTMKRLDKYIAFKAVIA